MKKGPLYGGDNYLTEEGEGEIEEYALKLKGARNVCLTIGPDNERIKYQFFLQSLRKDISLFLSTFLNADDSL